MIEHSLHFSFQASNNKAEFEALIPLFGLPQKFGATSLKIVSDSELVVNQVNSSHVAKCPTMAEYMKKVKRLMKFFEKVELRQLPKDENSHADALANFSLDDAPRWEENHIGRISFSFSSNHLCDFFCGNSFF